MIEIAGVSREFAKEGRSVVALQGIDLAVREGEFVALLGPSGCGKSTLLNMVAGFDFPTAGSVRVAGETVRAPSPQRGVVFQEPALFPWFSVMDNVVFGPKTRGEKAADYRPRAMQILEQVGLRGFEDAYPAELSGGMRQRVGIARVLMLESRVMLMDEPFGALDALTRSVLQKELMVLWRETKKTILFITHSADEAIYLADRVLVMTPRPGKIVLELKIDLPRPRDLTSPDFNKYKREILDVINPTLQSHAGGLHSAVH